MTEEQVCPSCGKPTGGFVPCPHCGADPRSKVSMRYVWAFCASILVLGGIFFYLHLATSAVSPTPIANIDSWLDYSYVWIEGTVVSGPRYGPTSFSFDVWDGSSENPSEATITAEVYSPAFEELLLENRIPRVGDHVVIFGQLRVPSSTDREIRISFPEDLQITEAQPVSTTISKILSTWDTPDSLLYRRVIVEGTITDIRPLSSANVYYLRDDDQEIQVYVHNGLGSYLEKRSLDLQVLDRVRIEAGLSEYSGQPQLAIARFDEIEVLSHENVPSVALSEINENLLDNYVRVSGKILFVELEGTGTDLEIASRFLWLDNEQYPKLVISEDKFEQLPRETRLLIQRGAQLEAIGKVARYGGSIVISWVGPQTPLIENGTWSPDSVENFALIDSSWTDRLVSLSGRVVSITERYKGALPPDRVLTVEDTHGNDVQIYMPNFIYERLTDPPTEGENVRVVGQVVDMSYIGSRVIQPGTMSDIEVI